MTSRGMRRGVVCALVLLGLVGVGGGAFAAEEGKGTGKAAEKLGGVLRG